MASKKMTEPTGQPTRRDFLKAAAGTCAAAAGAPFVHASDKAGKRAPVIGQGEHTYEVQHGWGNLPDSVVWGETHGVAIDPEGLIYIKHQAYTPQPMDAIVVFDPDGNCVRSFGKEFHGGGHGIDIRTEEGQTYLYLSDIKNRLVAKYTLTGEPVWKRSYPEESGVYERLEKYRPTNVAFAPDGGLFVGDGYGSHYIHHYDAEGNWKSTFGGEGNEPGKLRTPHGLWWDARAGRTPSLVVADRANARLQYFSAEGEHLGFVTDVLFPADIDIRGDILLVPDLHARVSLFDVDNTALVHLGYEPDWTKRVLEEKLRDKPDQWQPGKFIHPHDACFDSRGDIFVVEWVPIGRVSKLRHVG